MLTKTFVNPYKQAVFVTAKGTEPVYLCILIQI